jgi:mRNA-degrading endonuclease RelE of RelBE toxin-antitoxin system
LGNPSEREYREKLNKMSEKLNKRARDIRKDFAKIEKMKVDALKKSEEIKRSAEKKIDKMEKNITERFSSRIQEETPLRDCRAKKRNQRGICRTENANLSDFDTSIGRTVRLQGKTLCASSESSTLKEMSS